MASIIIPAHNEANVIGQTLASILPQLRDEDSIFVIANGCVDATESVARRYAPRVQVLTLAAASKTQALTAGDLVAESFPRIYMDADVQLEPGALDAIKGALADGPLLAVAPEPVMDLSRSSWAVGAYYSVWLNLPYCAAGLIGGGVYGLSQQGRARFDRFPNLIADDGYVRSLFHEHERGKVPGAKVRVQAPANLKWLMKIKVRSRVGQIQLAERFPKLVNRQRKAYGRGILGVLLNPLRFPAAMVYLYVALASRVYARKAMRQLAAFQWEKDDSSRIGKTEPALRGK